MATDHRGRGLHAGKRTNQEMGDSYSRQNSWGRHPVVGGMVYAKGQSPWHTAGMVVNNTDEDTTDYNWQVNAEGPVAPVTRPQEVVSTRQDLGQGKKALGYEGSNALVVSGKAKTPMRAMIAAEAMDKRIKEGRDLKTGRPKGSTPKSPSRPQPGDSSYPTMLAMDLSPRNQRK